ncbi:hypothetical protein CD149_12820 [Staphylococcus condimenti]|uniref:Uncharacterized protein n=1 Tax=Staphylococcus condimenti TaxID=70255 RepID=A0AB37H7Z4_9STAP|nr:MULTISPECIES: hypothetical protein [Staphylococcus]AMY06098.1 hypothetical protein A4G25_09245 [Staphylococcus condimenti]APR59976.1 hypothetical protein BTZ13_01645 [Staphylococcus condimenti]MDK8646206.1 hypothetical protein [Staphylococcus condimenti]OFP03907.1 hypothetical protein HMPREF3007_07185 [Staphylococcus sp. HMSC065E08]PNZ56470.1 hypothetical protein CD149_12820 [Staphylococcus condimenti]
MKVSAEVRFTITLILVFGVGFIIQNFFTTNSWVSFLFELVISVIVAFVLTLLINFIFEKMEKNKNSK